MALQVDVMWKSFQNAEERYVYHWNRPSRSRVMNLLKWVGESSWKLENVVFRLLELPITAENDVIVEQ